MPDTIQAQRFAFLGAESSGKSTLSAAVFQQLTQQYPLKKIVLIPEYAREYYANRPYKPTLNDVEHIAQEQMRRVFAANLDSHVVLSDTSAISCQVWAEIGFGQSTQTLTTLGLAAFDGIFLLSPDIPWEADPLRSHPQQRPALYAYHQLILMRQNQVWHEISGSFQQRLNAVLTIIQSKRSAHELFNK
jgi:nicotinamide riboside kinase